MKTKNFDNHPIIKVFVGVAELINQPVTHCYIVFYFIILNYAHLFVHLNYKRTLKI